MLTILNATKQTLLGDRISVADTGPTRNKGLLGHAGLEPGEGLWIIPTEAIHTFFMKFEIDVIFVDKKMRVTKIVHSMKKWRIAISWRAQSVVELPPGTARQANTQPGDFLEVRDNRETPG